MTAISTTSAAVPTTVTVYFSNVPKTITPSDLRPRFERVGQVINFRVITDKPNKNYGFCEYPDAVSAQRAVSLLNDLKLGESAEGIKVALGDRKRNRDGDRKDDKNGSQADVLLPDGRVPFRFPPTDPLLASLNQVAVNDGYEAVEQLRQLCLSDPEKAKALLEKYPQLMLATVVILQQAGKLPEKLPEEASLAPTSASKKEQHSGVGASSSALEPSEAEIMEFIEKNVSEGEVEEIMKLSEDDIAAIPDLAQRQQVRMIWKQLQKLSAE